MNNLKTPSRVMPAPLISRRGPAMTPRAMPPARHPHQNLGAYLHPKKAR